MYDLGVSYTFHFHKKDTESSITFLRNDVLILNGKENKEASAICFEIRIPKKRNEELLRKVPSKIYEEILLWKKTKKKLGLLIFPNIITEQWGYCALEYMIALKSMFILESSFILEPMIISESRLILEPMIILESRLILDEVKGEKMH